LFPQPRKRPRAIRKHWGIENRAHCIRDCSFAEDASRIRKNPGVFARIRSFEKLKPIPLVFWRSATGREPVREWLNELSREDERRIGCDMAKVQFGWPVGLPLCRPLSRGLWEVRSSLPSKREARVLFSFHDGMLIALHSFIKRTQATPDDDLALARQRLKEVSS
jgi:phage-related protein